MANYILNPYIAVTKKEDTYYFLGKNPQEIEAVRIEAPRQESNMPKLREAARAANMERLLAGEPVEQNRLARLIPAETLARMESRGWLLTEMPDMTSMYARSRAYCDQYLGPGAWEKLDRKSVMVLGCGGIGTHLAWHLATWGVGRLVLVDFDTVEESNLNRQLLFDRSDIGKKKTTALKERLLAINPDLRVEEVDLKVERESELERLFVVMNCDLIIKALDSPAEIPLWMDRVCRRIHQAYVAGITMQGKALIGPTFLPGKSEVGLSDLMPVDPSVRKVHGTAPSLGLVLYHVSDELAVEAFKVLTGCGALKYEGAMVLCDLFSGQEERLGAPLPGSRTAGAAAAGTTAAPEREAEIRTGDPDRGLPLSCLIMLSLSAAGLFCPWLWIAAGLGVLILPFYLYRRPDDRVRAAFVYALLAAGTALIGGLRLWLAQAASAVSMAALLFFVFMGVSAALLLVCFVSAGLSRLAGRPEVG